MWPVIPWCALRFRTTGDHDTQQRPAFLSFLSLRFFACEEDLSHESPDASDQLRRKLEGHRFIRALRFATAGNGYVGSRHTVPFAYNTSWNLRPEPHGQRSFLPSFSKSSFSQRITRKPALDFSFRRESLSTFAAWLEEEFAIHGSLSFQMDCPSHPKRKAVRLFYFRNPAEHRFCV